MLVLQTELRAEFNGWDGRRHAWRYKGRYFACAELFDKIFQIPDGCSKCTLFVSTTPMILSQCMYAERTDGIHIKLTIDEYTVDDMYTALRDEIDNHLDNIEKDHCILYARVEY